MMTNNTILLLSTIFGIGAIAIYWMYRKFRQAAYQPGMIAIQQQQQQQEVESSKKESSSSSFDNPKLYSKTTETTWTMPDGIELYHFPIPKSNNQQQQQQQQQQTNIAKNNTDIILALHGGPSIAPKEPWHLCTELWKEEQYSQIYLYHARGCGKSTRPFVQFPTPGKMWPGMKLLEETLGIGAQVADIERIRRRLMDDAEQPPNQKLHLVGHSFGGFLATMYAAEFPEHVQSLTLLVPASVLKFPPPSKDQDLFQIVQEKLEMQGNPTFVDEYKAFKKRYLDFGSLPMETDETLARRQYDFALHYFRAERGGKDDDDDNVQKKKEKKVDLDMIGGMACYATFLSMGMEHDYVAVCQERLAKSTFPVSIVHGNQDMVPMSTTQQYMQLFSKENTEFYLIGDADHDLYNHPDVIPIVKETMQRAKNKIV